MKHVNPLRRLEFGVQFKSLPFPQKGHPALANLGPRYVCPLPYHGLVVRKRELFSDLC